MIVLLNFDNMLVINAAGGIHTKVYGKNAFSVWDLVGIIQCYFIYFTNDMFKEQIFVCFSICNIHTATVLQLHQLK